MYNQAKRYDFTLEMTEVPENQPLSLVPTSEYNTIKVHSSIYLHKLFILVYEYMFITVERDTSCLYPINHDFTKITKLIYEGSKSCKGY